MALAVGASVLPLFSGTVEAQQAGYAVNRYEPSERGSAWFAADSLDFRGTARPAVGVVGDYSHHSLVIYNPDGSVRAPVLDHNLFVHVGAAIVLVERLRLGVSLPIQAYANGESGSLGGVNYLPPPKAQGIGDLRLSADARLVGEYGGAFRLAMGLAVWAPTGDPAQYTSDGEIRLMPRAMIAGDVGLFTYAAQAGYIFHGRNESFAGSPIGNEVQVTVAAGVRAGNIVFGPELYGTTYTDQGFKTRTTPLEILLGAHAMVTPDVRVGLGIGTGLTRGYGSPDVRALLGLEWHPAVDTDRDRDGIQDADDACPDTFGVASEDRSKHGCPLPPPPADRDKDGILDREDACIDEPGVKTADPKTNGCPADRDGDGITDVRDACPDAKGPKHEDPSLNGCPDTDGDGVFDKDDACVDVKGVKTTDPKTNGCPDPDRDKDTVLNEQDACPDEAGKPDPDPKRNGCPKAFVQAGQIKILDQVKFKTNSAQIDGKESDEVLQAVKKVLTDHPEIKKIRVEGHTDNRGGAALNRKLSAARAASVVKWLVGAGGIDAARLTSAGFGPDKPIDDNKTEPGRRNNRRVEFHIEESP